jgi:DNA-binding XRE family transcriptional regulator
MYSFSSPNKLTVGQTLAKLRDIYRPDNNELADALHMSYTTYLKTERDQRELSFLMALKICRFYKLDIHDFISMLSDEELERKDKSVIRVQQQRERKKMEAEKAKVIDINTGKIR